MDMSRRRRPLRPWQVIYLGLVLLRCLLAFSPGYIHPDEWFQSGEVVAGDLWNIPTLRTWEFEPDRPIRSMASLRIFALPLLALSFASKVIGFVPSASAIFAVQRATSLTLSFVIDASVFRLSAPRKAALTLCITAASSALLSIGARPFSNAQESAVLSACLVLLQSLERDWSNRHSSFSSSALPSLSLGALASVGLFTRFTFAIFAAPIALSLVALASKGGSIAGTISRLLPCLFSFLCTSIGHIIYDSRYYGGGQAHITPLNAGLYNMQTSNLELHGVHPRYLHALVNAPMILGAGVYIIFIRELMPLATGLQVVRSFATIEIVSASVVVFALAVLSIQPHQEPRFLLPLVTPVAVFISASRKKFGGRLIALSLIQHLFVTLLFSTAHQAGIVPSLIRVNKDLLLHPYRNVELHFWRSFMPPRHLLLPPFSKASVIDHGSTRSKAMPSALSFANTTIRDFGSAGTCILEPVVAPSQIPSDTKNDTLRLLFAPTWALVTLDEAAVPFTPLYKFRPHVDMDHLGEMLDVWRSGARPLTDCAAFEVVKLHELVPRDEIKIQLT